MNEQVEISIGGYEDCHPVNQQKVYYSKTYTHHVNEHGQDVYDIVWTKQNGGDEPTNTNSEIICPFCKSKRVRTTQTPDMKAKDYCVAGCADCWAQWQHVHIKRLQTPITPTTYTREELVAVIASSIAIGMVSCDWDEEANAALDALIAIGAVKVRE